MEPLRVTIGLSDEVINLQTLIQGFPADVPILLDDIVGRIVKLAGAADSSELEEYIAEMRYHLRGFDPHCLQELLNQIRHMCVTIRNIYSQHHWLDEYGSCEFRFNGYVGLFEIQIWRQVH